MTGYICISVPYVIGQLIPSRTETNAIQHSGLASELQSEWIEVQPDFAGIADPIVAVNRALAQTIAAHPGQVPLIFAADCVSALGAMKGLESYQPEVLWYDAHGDFNTPETTLSGFLGGMPLAMLVGRGDQRWMEGVGLKPIAESAITLTDARNLDPAEGEALANSQVRHLPRVSDLSQTDWPGKPLYIHLDIDVVNATEMPALAYPELSGPGVHDILTTLAQVRQRARIIGVLFSLYDGGRPGADVALQQTLRLARGAAGITNPE